MLFELCHSPGRAMARQVAAMCEQAHLRRTDAPRDQQPLAGSRHAHGNVCLALQQVLHAIGHRQFHGELRVRLPQAGDDRWQYLDAHDLARRHSHRAFDALALTVSGAPQRLGSAAHRARVR